MSTARALLAVLLATGPLAVAGCGSESASPRAAEETTTASAAPSATPGEPAQQTTARTDFCTRIPAADVRAALDGQPVFDQAWAPGTEAEVSGGEHAPGAEHGCSWSAQDGTTVTAWLFAAPVDEGQARTLAKKAARGCEEQQAPTHGSPGSTVQCINDDDTVTRAQGLFGDAWLSCSLQTPGILTRIERAASWCAAVRAAALP